MKSKIGAAVAMGLLATALSATVATAQCGLPPNYPGMMIKFDSDAWAYETAYTPATFTSATGSQLTVVGVVSLFCFPFADLDAAALNTEYTFIWDGLTSVGTTYKPVGSSGMQYTSRYVGGAFRIYADSPRNAPTAATLPALPAPGIVPDLFVDGTMILNGLMMDTLTVIVTRNSLGTYSSSFREDNYKFVAGGTLWDRVEGDPGNNLMMAVWCPVPASNPNPPSPTGTCQLPAGWSAHLNGKWDAPASVPALPSTWGKIKTLYR
jgi:hypothetical protein